MKFQPIHATGNGEVILSGSFAPDTANAPTTVYGTGFTVVRTSQGLFTITLSEAYIRLRAGTCQLQLAAKDTWFCQFGSIDVSSAKTVQIRVIDEANALVDVAADADNRIHFVLHLSKDSVTA